VSGQEKAQVVLGQDLRLRCDKGLKVALAPFLRKCPAVMSLGIRATISEYSATARAAILHAERIFFPTPRFVDIFGALDLPTFPNPTTYQYQRSRVLQQSLFKYHDLPGPRTRVYYGARQKARILKDFALPVLLLSPQAIPEKTVLVRNTADLTYWSELYNPVLVQEAVPLEERYWLLCVHYQILAAVRTRSVDPRQPAEEPVSLQGPALSRPLEHTRQLLHAGRLDDILVEWGYGKGRWWLLGLFRPPVRMPTMDGTLQRHQHICELIQAGVL
jgi:hypothetical protein